MSTCSRSLILLLAVVYNCTIWVGSSCELRVFRRHRERFLFYCDSVYSCDVREASASQNESCGANCRHPIGSFALSSPTPHRKENSICRRHRGAVDVSLHVGDFSSEQTEGALIAVNVYLKTISFLNAGRVASLNSLQSINQSINF